VSKCHDRKNLKLISKESRVASESRRGHVVGESKSRVQFAALSHFILVLFHNFSAFLDNHEPLDVIGNGSFGIIRTVRRKTDGLVRVICGTFVFPGLRSFCVQGLKI